MFDCWFFFFQAEDGIRDLVRSRGLGDVYKRQYLSCSNSIFLVQTHIKSCKVAGFPYTNP